MRQLSPVSPQLFKIWWHLKWICLKQYSTKIRVDYLYFHSLLYLSATRVDFSTSALNLRRPLQPNLIFAFWQYSFDLWIPRLNEPSLVVLLDRASNHYLLHSIYILGCYVKHGTWPTPSTATVWKGCVASREWFQPGEWQLECLKLNESQTPTGILDPLMHLCTPELSLNRDLLGNPLGGHIKNSIPLKRKWNKPFALDRLYALVVWHQYAISDSSLQGREGLTTQTTTVNLCLQPTSDFILHCWSHSRTFEMFSEFIINPHLRPKQCLF